MDIKVKVRITDKIATRELIERLMLEIALLLCSTAGTEVYVAVVVCSSSSTAADEETT